MRSAPNDPPAARALRYEAHAWVDALPASALEEAVEELRDMETFWRETDAYRAARQAEEQAAGKAGPPPHTYCGVADGPIDSDPGAVMRETQE